jgi:ribonuclease P protein component
MDEFISIKKNREFQRIYARGKSFVHPVLVCYVMKNRKKTVRLGITTGKKTGNAVKRNRSRRIIREAFRCVVPGIPKCYDLVFVSRARTPFVKSTDLCRVMIRMLKNAGVLR